MNDSNFNILIIYFIFNTKIFVITNIIIKNLTNIVKYIKNIRCIKDDLFMKILFISTGSIPHIGGKSTHILDLKDGLSSIGVTSEVISYTSINKAIAIVIKIILLPINIINKRVYSDILAKLYNRILLFKTNKYLKYNKVDCISAQDPQSACIAGKINKGFKTNIVLTMHSYFGIAHIDYNKANNGLTNDYFKEQGKKDMKSFEYINAIVAVDKRIKEHCKVKICESNSCFNKNNVYDIMNFTNINRFNTSDKEERKKAKEYFGFNENVFLISCVRRLVDKNGVIEAVKAMKYIENKNIMLLIGGQGPQKAEIDKFIFENKLEDRVIMLGDITGDKLIKLYKASDVSVVPSITLNGLQEATSISAIEAMSCGLPVIASDIGGLSQLIDNMNTGILVQEKKPEQIANYIIDLYENEELRNEIGNNARKSIEKNHSHIEGARKYLNIFMKTYNIKKEI